MNTQPNTRPTTRWLRPARAAWAMGAVVAVGILIISVPGYVRGLGVNAPVEAPAEFVSALKLFSSLASLTSALVSLSLSAALFWRKAEDGMAMFVSFYLLVYGIVWAGPLEALESTLGWSNALSIVAQMMLFTTPTFALFYLFPNGRFVPRWTRWFLLLSLVLLPMIVSVPADDWHTFASPTTWVFASGLAPIMLVGMYAQIYRYRHVSSLSERQQTKWVTFGLIAWMLFNVLTGLPYIYVQNIPPGVPLTWWVPLVGVGWWLSLNILPISITVAILRYRLFDIDLIIRRTLQYSVISALLALVYFGGVVALQRIFIILTGQGQNQLVAVLSTLAIAGLFNPVRRWVQDVIDRRFYRKKYDAAKVIAAFAPLAATRRIWINSRRAW